MQPPSKYGQKLVVCCCSMQVVCKYAVVSGCHDDTTPPLLSTRTQRNKALWAGAGCGKSGTCSLAAQLHDKGQLWTFFSALLLWRLRDPRIQKATSLEQLLRALLPDVSSSTHQELAYEIFALNGRGILAVLDGVDELVEYEDSFIVRLLRGEVLSEASFLATSHPCAMARKYLESSIFATNVELLGISEKQVDTYI